MILVNPIEADRNPKKSLLEDCIDSKWFKKAPTTGDFLAFSDCWKAKEVLEETGWSGLLGAQCIHMKPDDLECVHF